MSTANIIIVDLESTQGIDLIPKKEFLIIR